MAKDCAVSGGISLKHGAGKVVRIAVEEGHSTTSIVHRIRGDADPAL